MALEYNGQRIGAMQYGGVTIGEAMYNGQVVYRSSPYPATGTFNIVNVPSMSEGEVFSHTVVEPGNFTGTITPTSGEAFLFIWYLNGAVIDQDAGLTYTFTGLSVGDTIKVGAVDFGTLNLSGTWSIVKN